LSIPAAAAMIEEFISMLDEFSPKPELDSGTTL